MSGKRGAKRRQNLARGIIFYPVRSSHDPAAEGQTLNIPESPCPGCGVRVRPMGGINQDCAPVPGDVAVCLNCGDLITFDKKLKIQQAGLKRLMTLSAVQLKVLTALQC